MSEERSMEGDFDRSVTDATPLRTIPEVRPRRVPRAPQQLVAPSPGSNPDDDEYNMRHPRRGIALIFNHYCFEQRRLQPRIGTHKDCDDLSAVLSSLGFAVIVHNDLRYSDINSELERVRMMDHTDADCLLVAVMTHGSDGTLKAYDHSYDVERLAEPFTGDNCLSLVGKPKIFIIQACRGKDLDPGVNVAMDLSNNTYALPVLSDFLHVYSAPEGHASWRNERDGSWFIQALVQELKLLGRTRDLLTILTYVNRRVALDYQTSHPTNRNYDRLKIIPSFTSMLTRLLYFR